MKRIIRKIANLSIRLGLMAAILSAIASIVFAFISIEIAIATLAFALLCFIASTFFTNSRINKYVSVSARRLRVLTEDLTGGRDILAPELTTTDERILRELHLQTLEEVRVLHAEMISRLDKTQGL